MAQILPFPLDPRPTVLVVDDEPAIRGVTCEFLRDYGLNPIAAGDADHAIALIERGVRIDLVFSDVRMPGSIDGFDLARWVIAHKPGLPILLTSGDLGKIHLTRELAGIEIVPKPYDFDVVVRKIHAALNGCARRRA